MSYYAILATGSRCPKCHSTTTLLADDDMALKPAFYICWRCRHIAQVGVGAVEKYQAEDNEQ